MASLSLAWPRWAGLEPKTNIKAKLSQALGSEGSELRSMLEDQLRLRIQLKAEVELKQKQRTRLQ